jgi:glycosyltransferase involved in cell wall biosynthesis
MPKIALINNTSEYLFRFRLELINSYVSKGYDVILISPLDEYTIKFETLNVKWINWKLDHQSQHFFSEIISIFELYKILKVTCPDMLLCFTIKPIIYGSIIGRLIGIRKIFSMITGLGSIFSPFVSGINFLGIFGRIFYKIAISFNHFVFFQNIDDLNLFLDKNYLTKERAVHIYGSGVNLKKYFPVSKAPFNYKFILISRMLKEKGIYDFVGAAKLVNKIYPKARFILAGQIDRNPGSINLFQINRWSHQGLIKYIGFQKDIRKLLSQQFVFVLPSYYMEGVPRVIIEALAMGKPIITTNWRGCRDTVNGKNGYLVPIKDSKALANAMIKFIANPSSYHEMAVASRRLALRRFDVNHINDIVTKHTVLN